MALISANSFDGLSSGSEVHLVERKAHRIYRFYCKERMVNEVQGLLYTSLMQNADQLLAQQQRKGDACVNTLLAVDQHRTVVNTERVRQALNYSPYGFCSEVLVALGFNGERPDQITRNYPLGNGYREFSPVLMRFNTPDSMSPFMLGGLNPYAYCLGDPINSEDSSGHFSVRGFFGRLYGIYARNATGVYGFMQRGRKVLETIVPLGRVSRKNIPEGHMLVGYHGSNEIYTGSLEAGVTSQIGGHDRCGVGFYISQNYNVASGYAEIPSNRRRGHVFGVYSKNINELRKGIDFDYIDSGDESMVIRPGAFDKIVVRAEVRGPLVRRDSYYEKSPNAHFYR